MNKYHLANEEFRHELNARDRFQYEQKMAAVTAYVSVGAIAVVVALYFSLQNI
jgi:hypothetical protein